jgi:cell division septum initiation protein DivIVA
VPITKKQEDVPGVSEEMHEMQNRIDQLEKRNHQLEAELAGKIPQVSSASLHNYPEAEVDLPKPEPEKGKTAQPKTGASATAKEE